MSRRYRQSRRRSKRSYKRGLRVHRRNLSTASFSKRGGNRV